MDRQDPPESGRPPHRPDQLDPPASPPSPPMQYRPGPGSKPDNRLYAPQRDLAYLFPAAAREAFASLDQENWMGYYADILKANNITEAMLGEGVKRFVSAFQFFVGDSTVKSFDDALERTKFFDVHNLVRIMIFERLGEVMSVGFFLSVRDVARFGENPPQMEELAGLVEASHAFVWRLNGSRAPDRQRPRPVARIRDQYVHTWSGAVIAPAEADGVKRAAMTPEQIAEHAVSLCTPQGVVETTPAALASGKFLDDAEMAPALAVASYLLKVNQQSLANQQKLTTDANAEIDRLRKELRDERRLGFWRKFLRMCGVRK